MWDKILRFVSLKIISPFKWTWLKYFLTGKTYDLKSSDRESARDLMTLGSYLWVSRRDSHLTTYLISFLDWLLVLKTWIKNGREGMRPRFGFWSHAFMNYDNNEIVEAVGKGVVRNFFDEAFDCDAIAALVPKNISRLEWATLQPKISKELERQIGKKYDTNFDLSEGDKVSCIELVRIVLKNEIEGYDLKFSKFEAIIKMYKNVTPQMLYESKDFVVVWEVRRK
jgi:hypothetical protein